MAICRCVVNGDLQVRGQWRSTGVWSMAIYRCVVNGDLQVRGQWCKCYGSNMSIITICKIVAVLATEHHFKTDNGRLRVLEFQKRTLQI